MHEPSDDYRATFLHGVFENDGYRLTESLFGGKMLTLYCEHWSEKQAELLSNLLVVAKILIKLYLYFWKENAITDGGSTATH